MAKDNRIMWVLLGVFAGILITVVYMCSAGITSKQVITLMYKGSCSAVPDNAIYEDLSKYASIEGVNGKIYKPVSPERLSSYIKKREVKLYNMQTGRYDVYCKVTYFEEPIGLLFATKPTGCEKGQECCRTGPFESCQCVSSDLCIYSCKATACGGATSVSMK